METSVSAALWEQAQSTPRPITLDLRGTLFTLDRATLIELPENILLCLFPQGLFPLPAANPSDGVLDRDPESDHDHDHDHDLSAQAEPRLSPDQAQHGLEPDAAEDIYYSDFDPTCLSYVLSFFKSAQDDFYGTPTQPGRYRAPGAPPLSRLYPSPFYTPNGQSPLLSRQAVIVLREELEYYVVPSPPPPEAPTTRQKKDLPPLRPIDFSQPTAQQELAALAAAYEPDSSLEVTNLVTGVPTAKLLQLKEKAGQALLNRRHIFTALQRNVNKENNVAEQHLIDMLCMRYVPNLPASALRSPPACAALRCRGAVVPCLLSSVRDIRWDI